MNLEDRQKFIKGKEVRIKGTNRFGYIDYAKINNPSNDGCQVFVNSNTNDEDSITYWKDFDDLELID